MNHQLYMEVCLDLDEFAFKNGNPPVGAILVHHNQIVAQGFEAGKSSGEITDHAEVKRIALLDSIYPTLFFNKNKKGEEGDQIEVPASIKYMIRLELLLLFIIPLTATIMAKGIGYFGD